MVVDSATTPLGAATTDLRHVLPVSQGIWPCWNTGNPAKLQTAENKADWPPRMISRYHMRHIHQ